MVEKRNLEREEQFNLAVDVLMLAGTLLLQSGSEIYRVEDTMIRIAPLGDMFLGQIVP